MSSQILFGARGIVPRGLAGSAERANARPCTARTDGTRTQKLSAQLSRVCGPLGSDARATACPRARATQPCRLPPELFHYVGNRSKYSKTAPVSTTISAATSAMRRAASAARRAAHDRYHATKRMPIARKHMHPYIACLHATRNVDCIRTDRRLSQVCLQLPSSPAGLVHLNCYMAFRNNQAISVY